MKEWSIQELAQRLAAGELLSVLDIRESQEYEEWHIPGSTNLPTYMAINQGDLGAFSRHIESLPRDRPIVTVCRQGNTSQHAVRLMEAQGLDAVNLKGGISAWGTLWTGAVIDMPGGDKRTFLQIRRNGKGCLSYLFGDRGEAAVVDPSITAEDYVALAQEHGLKITRVLETHVHADHVSRARQLCSLTGASLHLATNQRVSYPYHPVADGEPLTVGGIAVRVLTTPGHTHESVSYLMENAYLLSGDTLFTNGVGRPDLEKGDAGVEESAELLYLSLHDRLLSLPGSVRVFPGHTGAGLGFDGAVVEASLGQLADEIELLAVDQAEFTRLIRARLTKHPPNYTHIIAVNEGKLELGGISPFALEAGPNRCAVG
jgi:glyoxylase-like metal-dependent hydrolase (beta-lactamase superfamily II)/rhodanese-related sulfurtransferase